MQQFCGFQGIGRLACIVVLLIVSACSRSDPEQAVRAQVDALMRGEEPPPPADWTDDDSSGGKGTPSKPRSADGSKTDSGVIGGAASSH